MNTKAAITSQFLAALEMMKQVVTKCPDDLWHNTAHTNKFWHLAYHGLFYTHLYLQQSEETFTPWPKHRANINYLGQMPYPPHDKIDPGKPYSRAEILDYIAICQQEVQKQTDSLNLEAASGFSWIPLNKFELQFYNIRHLQLHIGELCERLWAEAGVEVNWVGKFPND